MNGDRDIGDADDAPAHQHDDHGDHGLARAPQDAGDAMGKCQQAVEQRDRMSLGGAVPDDLGIIVECGNKHGSQYVDADPDDLGKDDRADDAKPGAAFYPVEFLGAKILSDEGGQRQSKAGDGQEAEALDLGVSATAGYRHFTKAVDIGLDDDIGKGNDGILQSCGQAVGNDHFQVAAGKTDLPQGYAVILLGPHKSAQAQQGTDKLGNDGGQRRRAHAPVEDTHKQQVQHHIDDRGNDEVYERMTAITHGLQDAHKNVVHDKGQGPQKINSEIDDRIFEHIGRRAHPGQYFRSEDQSEYSQQQTRGQSKGNVGVDGLFEIFLIPGAKIPGDDHPGAHGYAVEKSHKEQDETARGADRGQCVAAEKISHNEGICRIVKLLE